MRTQHYIVLAAILALPLLTRAEDTVISDSLEATMDSVVIAEDSVPDWYVEPVIPSELRAPMRANAGTCLTDSILIFDVDSILTEATTYDYDEAGRAFRTTIWNYAADGTRAGKSKQEYAYDASGTQIYTGTFAWDATTNDWKGTSKTEFVYNEAHKMESKITYTWTNNTWLPSTAYTYQYDEAGHETVYTTYTRDAAANHLVPSKQRLRTYDGSRIIVEINYTAYTNNAWSAGNRKSYTFDENGRQVAYYYYTAISNGEFVPGSSSSYELKSYDEADNVTSYEKRTWSSNKWKGSTHYERTYNEDGEMTLNLNYKWSNNNWVYNSKYIYGFDENGNSTEEAVYSWTNNTYWRGTSRTTAVYNASGTLTEETEWAWSLSDTCWIGSSRLERIYSGSRLICTQNSTYANGAWVYTTKTENHYTSSGKRDTTANYTWNTSRNDWDGTTRTYYQFDSRGNTILTVNDSWSELAWHMTSMTRSETVYDSNNRQIQTATYTCGPDTVWQGSSKTEYDYTPSGSTLQTRYYGSYAAGDWVMTYHIDNTYDEAERKTIEEKWTLSGSDWIGSYRNEFSYNAQGIQYMTASYRSWDKTLQIWIGRTKTEKIYDASGTQTGLITYSWVNNAWQGTTRYTYAYDASNREVSQLVENYDAALGWVYSTWYEKEYEKNTLVRNNQYTWRDNAWQYVSRVEKTYDPSNKKIRRDIAGTWSLEGVLSSFTDKHYFYSCDAPATNGSQPRTPTDIQNATIHAISIFDEPTTSTMDFEQPFYNLSGQRVDPATYHGIVIHAGHTHFLP